jgi:hypothetical protein
LLQRVRVIVLNATFNNISMVNSFILYFLILLPYTGGPGWLNEIPNNSYKPITNVVWVRVLLCKLQKGCTRLAARKKILSQYMVEQIWIWIWILVFNATFSNISAISWHRLQQTPYYVRVVARDVWKWLTLFTGIHRLVFDPTDRCIL